MSLDFAVLGPSDVPERTVSLGVELHHGLVVAARVFHLSCMLEFSEYYEDVEISSEKLPGLAGEIRILQEEVPSSELQKFLGDLRTLVDYAIHSGRPLHAIAD